MPWATDSIQVLYAALCACSSSCQFLNDQVEALDESLGRASKQDVRFNAADVSCTYSPESDGNGTPSHHSAPHISTPLSLSSRCVPLHAFSLHSQALKPSGGAQTFFSRLFPA